MEKAIINQIILKVKDAFEKLNTKVQLSEIEKIAITIHDAMLGGRRNFHTADHIFHIVESMDALQVFAGLFHDIIYFQVDDGFPKSFNNTILNFIEVNKEKEVIIKQETQNDLIFEICLKVFDFKKGQKLSIFGGLNEFLSCFVALHTLQNFLSLKQLLIIAIYIEATIPFRKSDDKGRSPYDILEKRLAEISKEYKIPFEENEIEQCISKAVQLANRDVENFSFENTAIFLANTWALIPETNSSLWVHQSYTIKDYRLAIMKMEAFMVFLSPESVFHQYKNTPENKVYESLITNAKRNIEIARKYLGIKLITISILEAFALITGGDAPISMFLGDKTDDDEGKISEKAEHFLPKMEEKTNVTYDNILKRLLKVGRSEDASFDIRNSPFSTFTYTIIGDEGIDKHLLTAKKMFKNEITPIEFLKENNPEVVKPLANACAKIAITRKDLIVDEIIKKL